MTEKIDKMEAAKRQIEASIKMLFDNYDIVPIHSNTRAGLEIVRNLAKKREIDENYFIDSVIMQNENHDERKWLKQYLLGETSSFIKHANRDPGGMLSPIDEDDNNLLIFFAIVTYEALGGEMTIIMQAFIGFYISAHPEMISDDVKSQLAGRNIDDCIGNSRVELKKLALQGITEFS